MSDAMRADALLDEAPREGAGNSRCFGAAPGVGKTYAMLQAAQRQRRLGRDVRVGWWRLMVGRKPQPCWSGLPTSRCAAASTVA